MGRVIVIGGVAAGMSAAAQAKRSDRSLEVIVFEKGEHISYGACGLPYFLSNPDQRPEDLVVLTPEKAEEKKGVKVRINSEATSIDLKNKKITVKNLKDKSEEEFYYDKLIIATGAASFKPSVKGIDSGRVFFLKTLSQGIKLKEFLVKEKPSSCVIYGEGHIGLEAAENFAAMGIKDITIIAKRSHLCWWLDKDMAEHVEKKAEENGIKILRETQVNEIREEGNGTVVVTDKGDIRCGFVFVSQGMKPNSSLAKDAGIKTGMRGSIDVNSFCETSAKDVYAAGDCANIYSIPDKDRIYMPRGTTANRQGRTAGRNAAGVKKEIKGITGIVVFRFFDLEIGRVGIWEEEAKRKKIETVSAMIKYVTRPSYYPGGKRIFVKLTADKKSGKLLGGQIAGGEGVAKRIDILSASLYNDMTVEEMQQLDLSYAPPFAPVWDPVLIAVNNLVKLINN